MVEAGTGAGAGLLCLVTRVAGVRGVGVELDPAMADLARRNLRDNALASCEVVTGDIAAMALGRFDHALANPPWHDPRSTASPVERRRQAKQGAALEDWIAALGGMMTIGGSLSLILPASQSARASAAMARSGLGRIVICGLLPKAGRPAKLSIVQGRLGADTKPVAEGWIVLHEANGTFTPAIEAVLRRGAALPDLSSQPVSVA